METKQIQNPIIYPDGRMDSANTALYIGNSPKTLATWRCQGKGPPFIKRGKVFYYKSAVDAWLRDGKHFSEMTA